MVLVNEFLENYNSVFPIFHPPTLMSLLGQQYSQFGNTIADPTLSVALNAILAMAQRRRATQSSERPELADAAWIYARNSLETLLAVLMRNVTLLSVQAILVLAWFFRGTPNPQPFFFLTAAAVRLSHSAGLHRTVEDSQTSSTELEQRLRVFWLAYMFDSEASLRTGRPCSQVVNDIGVPLPSESPKDKLGMIVDCHGTTSINILLARAKFAIIRGKVYDRLFASSATEKSTESIAEDILKLGEELDIWKRTSMHMIDHSVAADDWDNHSATIRDLYIAYHSCHITVYSASWQRHFQSYKRKDTSETSHISRSPLPHADKCVDSARAIINHLAHIPRENDTFIWYRSPISHFNTID